MSLEDDGKVIEDKAFVVSSNDYVNQVSGIKTQSQLSINFEKDILCENPKAFCLIVEENKDRTHLCKWKDGRKFV